jgi:hypothetical protein
VDWIETFGPLFRDQKMSASLLGDEQGSGRFNGAIVQGRTSGGGDLDRHRKGDGQ